MSTPTWLSMRGYGLCAKCRYYYTTRCKCPLESQLEREAARKDETAHRRTAPRGTWK